MDADEKTVKIVVKSFCNGSDKIDLSTILWWYMMKTPQAKILEQFLMDIFPKLSDGKGHKDWNLNTYGAMAASEAIIFMFCGKPDFDASKSLEFHQVLKSWLEQHHFAYNPTQWHKCSNDCHQSCTIEQRHIQLLRYIFGIVTESDLKSDLPYLARFFVLYNQVQLVGEIDHFQFTFEQVRAMALFFSTSSRRMKMFVLQHSHPSFKELLANVVKDKSQFVTLKGGRKYSSSDVYMHLSDCTAILSPEQHCEVRKQFGIGELSMSDFISACDAANYPLVKSMIDAEFPTYIRKRDHLTQILRALSACEPCPEWDSVFQYVQRVTEEKCRLHAEDTICFMVRQFFLSKKAVLSVLTNWDRPPIFTGGTPLLTNYTLLKELDDNNKLANWSRLPRIPRIDIHVTQHVDPRCLNILKRYNMFGVFYA